MLTPMQTLLTRAQSGQGSDMQTGETAWNPAGVGKVSLCAGLHGGPLVPQSG